MSKKSKPKKPTSANPSTPSRASYQVGYQKPPVHTRWKKGQSGNPSGGQAHDKELKAIKNLTNQELIEVANMVIKGNAQQLKELARNDEETVLKRMLASVCVKVITKGDMAALDVLLNRLVGKVKDHLDLGGIQVSSAAQVIISLPSNGRERERIPA